MRSFNYYVNISNGLRGSICSDYFTSREKARNCAELMKVYFTDVKVVAEPLSKEGKKP